MNIKLWVANTENSEDTESQIYTNYQGLTVSHIHDVLGNSAINPEIGNFPHMSGDNNPVLIADISATNDEDNAGLDINEVLSRFRGFAPNST